MKETNITSTKDNKPNFYSQNSILAAVAVIVLCLLSFYVGTLYQKSHNRAAVAVKNTAAVGSMFGRLGGARPNIGTVSSVSSSSITITGLFNSADQTFAITSSTTVTNNGQSTSVSDIKTGDRVLVQTSGSGSTTATQIDVNPTRGGGSLQQGSSSSSI